MGELRADRRGVLRPGAVADVARDVPTTDNHDRSADINHHFTLHDDDSIDVYVNGWSHRDIPLHDDDRRSALVRVVTAIAEQHPDIINDVVDAIDRGTVDEHRYAAFLAAGDIDDRDRRVERVIGALVRHAFRSGDVAAVDCRLLESARDW